MFCLLADVDSYCIEAEQIENSCDPVHITITFAIVA